MDLSSYVEMCARTGGFVERLEGLGVQQEQAFKVRDEMAFRTCTAESKYLWDDIHSNIMVMTDPVVVQGLWHDPKFGPVRQNVERVVRRFAEVNDRNENRVTRFMQEDQQFLHQVRTSQSPLRSSQLQRNGCYIATAVYGAYDAPEVRTLRRLRDESLSSGFIGRCLIRLYYAISPTLAAHLPPGSLGTRIARSVLDYVVHRCPLDRGVGER